MDDESSPSLASFLVPVVTIGLVLFVQVNFWLTSSPAETEDTIEKEEIKPSTSSKQAEEKAVVGELDSDVKKNSKVMDEQSEQVDAANNSLNDDSRTLAKDKDNETAAVGKTKDETEDLFERSNQWRCVCEEGSFLPPALLKTFGPAEAMVRLGTGQCYHKQM